MKAYLDNNIFVDIESGIIPIERVLSNSEVTFFFSAVHMGELINGLVKHPELKSSRLQTIECLCASHYFTPDVGPFRGGFEEVSPQKAFDLSMQYKYGHDQLYRMSNAMTINRDGFLQELKMEKLEVGNYKPSEIFNVLEERLKKNLGYGIQVFLEKSLATTGRTVFSSLFNLLDFVCYWHDKNNVARLYDSSHAYFGQYCDVLVSNDKRMRIKTVAVYSYLDIGTKVCSGDEFFDLIAVRPIHQQ